MPHRWIKRQGTNLLQLKDTPVSIARGVAFGTFFGFVPLIGFKTLLSMGAARLFRGNVVASAVAVTLHDIILPLAPLILKWEYDLGRLLMGRKPVGAGLGGHGHRLEFSQWFHWSSFGHFGLPLLLGSVVVGAPAGILAFFGTRIAVERARARRAAAEEAEVAKAVEEGQLAEKIEPPPPPPPPPPREASDSGA